MSELERFAELVSGPTVPLGEACLHVAAHLGHPQEVTDGLVALDDLASAVSSACARNGRRVDLAAVADGLFVDLGFSGNTIDYYDPRNSLLPSVLARRTGIPITLSIVVIEVAARLDVPAVGVGMPGHFLVGDGRPPQRWLDAFDGGTWLDRRGAEARFRGLHGPAASFDPAFLDATPGAEIVGRVLNNLAIVHRNLGDPTRLLRALELRAEIPQFGSLPRAQVELAQALEGVGRVADALGVLERVRPLVDGRTRPKLDQRIAVLRASLN